MKLFLLIIALLITIPALTIDSTQWTQPTKEELELRAIMQRIAQINEYFTSLGARNSSSRHGAIFGYLRQMGTPTAYTVLKQLVNNGDLPKYFLNMAQAYS